MTYVDAIECDNLRIVVCLQFEPHAIPDDIAALKAKLIECPNTLHAIESTGAFDFLVEVAPPDLAWWNSWRTSLADPLARLVARFEISFACKRFIRRTHEDRALWVPTNDGRIRVECSAIDKVLADGDYVHLFSGERQWLLHATMHALRAMLQPPQFVQLHRSLIVRSAFVIRLFHSGRQWIAQLRDGTSERVSRSHVAEVLDATRPSNALPESSNIVQLADRSARRSTKM